MTPSDDPDAIFASVARSYAARADIQLGEGFDGGPGMRASGELFAALSDGALVVKLPPGRCAQLVDAGEGHLLQDGGQTLEDWLVVPGVDAAHWMSLVTEALGLARG
jgi:hypothetical protein